LRYPVVKLLDWRDRDDELAASGNPFAVVVRAYLAAQATYGALEARSRAKLGLIRRLYERGYERAQILELFRLIDWLLALPQAQEEALWQEIVRIEEERRMPYITSVERIGLREGRLQGLQEGELRGQRAMLRRLLQARFGTVPEVLGRQIDDADQERLDQLADRIGTASSLDELGPEVNKPGSRASRHGMPVGTVGAPQFPPIGPAPEFLFHDLCLGGAGTGAAAQSTDRSAS
jgi:hypothetical protein